MRTVLLAERADDGHGVIHPMGIVKKRSPGRGSELSPRASAQIPFEDSDRERHTAAPKRVAK